MTTTPPPAPGRPALPHRLAFWTIAFAFLTVMGYNALPAPLYGLYQRRDHFSSFMLTVVFAAYAVGVVISLFSVGHLSDWHGRRRLFVPALVVSMLSAVTFLVWPALPGLVLGRFIGGLGVGMVTATATAWLVELHRAARPQASLHRAQVVSTAANLGGIGTGPLVAGALAQWAGHPLTIPFLVALAAMGVALLGVLTSPETRAPVRPRPVWRPQRVVVPAAAVSSYVAAGIGAAIAFAVFGLFTSLAPAFLAGPLHQHSLALAGATAFAVFAAAVISQTAIRTRSQRPMIAFGIVVMLAGLAVIVVSVWLPAPVLALFLIGAVVTGAGAGSLFRGVVAMVAAVAPPARRAEALAGMFLAGYIGLSVPVLALGVLTQYLSPRVSLLSFTAALAAGVMIVSRRLLAGGSEATDEPRLASAPVGGHGRRADRSCAERGREGRRRRRRISTGTR